MSDTPADPSHLRLERRDDGVAVLTLDDPDRRNAMSAAMTASWQAAIDRLAGLPRRGAGDGVRDRRDRPDRQPADHGRAA